MSRYFLVALLFAIIAVGGITLYGLGSASETVARGTFGVGFLGACVTVAIGLYRKTRRPHP